MKKKIGIGILIFSALIHVVLLIMQFMKLSNLLSNPNDFDLFPLLWVIVLLLLLLGHVAIYVMIMDYKEKLVFVSDTDEWWKKWDEVSD